MTFKLTPEELLEAKKVLYVRRVKSTTDLIQQDVYTIIFHNSAILLLVHLPDLSKFKDLQGTSYNISQFVDNDDTTVYKGMYVGSGVIVDGNISPLGLYIENAKVTYKAYSEKLDTVELSKDIDSTFRTLIKVTKQYYQESLNGIVPEVHIIGQDRPHSDTEVISEDLNSHDSIIKEYHSVVSEISEASRQINQNTKLEDLADISETFLATREKLKDLAQATTTRATSIFDKFKGIPLIGKAIAHTTELKNKTDSVQDNIDALFIQMNKQYNRLVAIGEGLQRAKQKQETQCLRLEALIEASENMLKKYLKQSDIPIKELSANNQIKTSYEKLKKRILKTEAAIMGTQASIISLGKDLPTSKAEMTEELALSSLLNSVTDYQGMYHSISELLNEVVEVTSEKTYKVVENLMDMQINDTHTLKYLAKDNAKAQEFAQMLTDKSQKLANKVVNDANMIKEIAKGTSIALAREKVVSLGYNTGTLDDTKS